MKFMTVGQDVPQAEAGALKKKFKLDDKNTDIVVLGHTDEKRERIGGMNAKEFVKQIISYVGKKKKGEIQHIHLIGCEAGFVNEKGESLAQAIANEFKKQKCDHVIVHAVSNQIIQGNTVEYVPYAGMRVEVVSKAGTLHHNFEGMEDGHVCAYGYKTKEALALDDRLSELGKTIKEADIKLKSMPERINNNEPNKDKQVLREKLRLWREEEKKLLEQRKQWLNDGTITRILGTNNPYQDICQNKNYEFQFGSQKPQKQDVEHSDITIHSSSDSETSLDESEGGGKPKKKGLLKKLFVKKDKNKEEKKETKIEPVNITLPDTLQVDGIQYRLKDMAGMLQTFSVKNYQLARVAGNSSEAKWKKRWVYFFGKKAEERSLQIKELHDLAETVTKIYERKPPLTLSDPNDLTQAGEALINKVNEIYGKLTVEQKKYFKQSNLLTNLEVVLSKTKAGHELPEKMKLNDENMIQQLMFKDQLKQIQGNDGVSHDHKKGL